MPTIPERTCDIVMKGGITSGIVYPLAVVELSNAYRFVNIGGTSAGAIAAAGTAAAEHGRQRIDGQGQGFARLANVPGEIGTPISPDSEDSKLFSLFQPHEKARPLFNMLLAAISHPKNSAPFEVALAAIRSYRRSSAVGATPGVLVFAFLVTFFANDADRLLEAAVLIAALFGAVAMALAGAIGGTAVALLKRAPRSLREGFWGACTGNWVGTPGEGEEPLTPWLGRLLDEASGEEVLTFGHLAGDDEDNPTISLAMMTTCLTFGRPYRLPFEPSDAICFDPDELLRLFPEPIVNHMVMHSNRVGIGNLHHVPAKEQLPVLVAARLSLSFPFLLSAVPLWHVGADANGQLRVTQCWFSDGGICSNFPVHFFDSPLPRRPTFGLNLGTAKEGDERVSMPSLNVEFQEHERPIGEVAQFASGIRGAMQNWHDNLQSALPGYRDRIVSIRLLEGEGGLNLNMPRELIRTISGLGADAGQLLVSRFSTAWDDPESPELSWDNHRWIRLRSALGALEEVLELLAKGYFDHDEERLAWILPGYTPIPPPPGQRSYADLVSAARAEGYAPMDSDQQEIARSMTWLTTLVAQLWLVARGPGVKPESPSMRHNAPLPPPELRMTHRI